MIPDKVDTHQLINILMTTLNVRDPNTFGHSWRVAEIAVLISEKMGLDRDFLTRVHIAAHLHDIGKIGISDEILKKPGRLTKEEMGEMQRHPVIGYEILENISIFKEISPIVLYHHERYDGKGYPEGLKAEEIPLASRIISVADAFDAITSNRPYRQALDYNFAFEEINNHVLNQFCPLVVENFNQIRNLIPEALLGLERRVFKYFSYIDYELEEIGHEQLIHSKKVN